MIPNQFEYYRPDSLQDALSLLSKHGDDAKILAGGVSLLSVLKLRLSNPKFLIDLGGLGHLNYLRDEPEGNTSVIAIGAMTPYCDIKESKLLRSKCPLLPQTACVIGDVQIRNRGTLGGSLAHADPAGDMPASILALGAELKIIGPHGERSVNALDFFLGMYTTELAPDEILTEIRVPVLQNCKTAYLKMARRPSDFAMVGVAICLKAGKDAICEDISLGITGLTDKPFRATEAEVLLKGKNLNPENIGAAAQTLTDNVDVTGNLDASSEFRSHLARVYLGRAIQAAS